MTLAELKARDIIYKMKQYKLCMNPMDDIYGKLKVDKYGSKRQALHCVNFIIDATKSKRYRGIFIIRTEITYDPFWLNVREIINDYNYDLL